MVRGRSLLYIHRIPWAPPPAAGWGLAGAQGVPLVPLGRGWGLSPRQRGGPLPQLVARVARVPRLVRGDVDGLAPPRRGRLEVGLRGRGGEGGRGKHCSGGRGYLPGTRLCQGGVVLGGNGILFAHRYGLLTVL